MSAPGFLGVPALRLSREEVSPRSGMSHGRSRAKPVSSSLSALLVEDRDAVFVAVRRSLFELGDHQVPAGDAPQDRGLVFSAAADRGAARRRR